MQLRSTITNEIIEPGTIIPGTVYLIVIQIFTDCTIAVRPVNGGGWQIVEPWQVYLEIVQ